jgi:oligoendopeptidase F
MTDLQATLIEDFKSRSWQRQLHLFEVPFYYIEYGIAQLGALAIWKNSKKDLALAIQDYKSALKLGYTQQIPEIYQTAGIEFNFSEKYIQDLAQFLKKELENLNN